MELVYVSVLLFCSKQKYHGKDLKVFCFDIGFVVG